MFFLSKKRTSWQLSNKWNLMAVFLFIETDFLIFLWYKYVVKIYCQNSGCLFVPEARPFPISFFLSFFLFFFFLTRRDFLQNLSWLNQVSLETMAFLRKLKETQGNHNKKSLNSENLWENFRQDILQHYRNSSVTIYLKFFGIFHSLYHYLFL